MERASFFDTGIASTATSSSSSHVKQQTRDRILAALIARVLLLARPRKDKGAGKAGRQLAPVSPCAMEDAHGWTTGVADRSAFPARMVLTVSFVLSSGSVALLPPSPCGFSDARTRSGRRITASLDAQTPGVRTTRLLRPRTIWPRRPGLGVRTPDHRPNRCDRAVSYAHRLRLTVARPVLKQTAPALPRPPHPGPHLVTIAKRPSGRTGMANTCHKSEIRKSDIFLCDEVDRFWVFCPTPLR